MCIVCSSHKVKDAKFLTAIKKKLIEEMRPAQEDDYILAIDSEQIAIDEVGTVFSDLHMSIEIPWELVTKSRRGNDETVFAVSSVLHNVENLFPAGFFGSENEAS